MTSTYEALLSREELESVARVDGDADLRRERLLTRVLMRYSIAAGLSLAPGDRVAIAKVGSSCLERCSVSVIMIVSSTSRAFGLYAIFMASPFLTHPPG